jgi:hypothetical protein
MAAIKIVISGERGSGKSITGSLIAGILRRHGLSVHHEDSAPESDPLWKQLKAVNPTVTIVEHQDNT